MAAYNCGPALAGNGTLPHSIHKFRKSRGKEMRVSVSGLVLLGGVMLSACASMPKTPQDESRQMVAGQTVQRLETFRSEQAFARYLETVELAEDLFWRRNQNGQQRLRVDIAPPEEFECPEDDPVCQGDFPPNASDIVVTGGRISSSSANPPITNNQEAGVEEGDIVKQIGDFLVILQDGRLFSVNLMPNGQPGLDYVDRFNVYRGVENGGWYDEMLVMGNRVVVTAYSYSQGASEVTIIEMDETGKFSFIETFFISSDDYYSDDNYATRIIGDKFIVYSPIHLDGFDWQENLEYPVVRRWQTAENFDKNKTRSKQLFAARDIHRPLQDTLEPVLHTVSICDIGGTRKGRDLDCQATAFIGSSRAEFYVSPDSVYVWIWPSWDDLEFLELVEGDCEMLDRRPLLPSAIYRVSISGAPLEVTGAIGQPVDQFSMAATGAGFRSLTQKRAICDGQDQGESLALLNISRSNFSNLLRKPSARQLMDLTVLEKAVDIENRWTDDHLVYAAGQGWHSGYPSEESEKFEAARLVIVPAARPGDASEVILPGSVLRIERVGNDIVTTGYRDASGLQMSYIDLSGAPALAATTRLQGLYESEGRSHAFNSLIRADGSGLIGIPTLRKPEGVGRWWWNSMSSNVSFVSLSSAKDMVHVGDLQSGEDAEHEDYDCEISCIDWYGNSRPIFTNGRILALAATELVEGVLTDGKIYERARVNLTAPLKAHAAR